MHPDGIWKTHLHGVSQTLLVSNFSVYARKPNGLLAVIVELYPGLRYNTL
jgi:hypothetical protein